MLTRKITTVLFFLFTQVCYTSSQKFSFVWSASLDKVSGKASSLETSTLPSFTFNGKKKRTNVLILHDFFLNYPCWLCNWKILGGLFRPNSNKCEVSVCDSIFGCHLLRFGKPRDISNFIRGKQISIEIPIVGGLLARKPGGCLRFSVAQDTGILKTEIDSYCPWIAGDTPISCLREGLYLNSQSFFHAYVMWRFHRDCFYLMKSKNCR